MTLSSPFLYLCFTKIWRLGKVKTKIAFSFAFALAFVIFVSRKCKMLKILRSVTGFSVVVFSVQI